MFCFVINAQSFKRTSIIEPVKSNGFIYWEKGNESNFSINIYQMINNNLTLVRTDYTSDNYFKFNASQLLSSDLYYEIWAFNSNGAVVSKGDPVKINPNSPPPSPYCFKDCNGKKEAFRIYQMQQYNGGLYLMASNEAGVDIYTGQQTIFYQAVDESYFVSLNPNHPYKKTNSAGNYDRGCIMINQYTPGGPFWDATNNVVINGRIIEKRMDKYAHFNSANTGTYTGMDSWCDAALPTAVSNFNSNVETGTLMPITGEQYWFFDQTGTNGQGQPIYTIPNGLYCSENGPTDAGGSTSSPYTNDMLDLIKDCFYAASVDNGDPVDCIAFQGDTSSVLSNGAVLNGITIGGLKTTDDNYFVSIDNKDGVKKTLRNIGVFERGLHRVIFYYNDGSVRSFYTELGVQPKNERITVDIYPNVINGRNLKFGLTSSLDANVSLYVQKLDGTTVYTEQLNLVNNQIVNRDIEVSGDIPYNQLRVSVVLPDGTTIQKTAMAE